MNRGDVVTVTLPGDLGKPRPAIILQSDHFLETRTVTVLPLTSTCVEAPLLRIDIPPDEKNRLRDPSQVMIDKVMTVKRERVGQRIGCITPRQQMAINRALIVFMGIA